MKRAPSFSLLAGADPCTIAPLVTAARHVRFAPLVIPCDIAEVALPVAEQWHFSHVTPFTGGGAPQACRTRNFCHLCRRRWPTLPFLIAGALLVTSAASLITVLTRGTQLPMDCRRLVRLCALRRGPAIALELVLDHNLVRVALRSGRHARQGECEAILLQSLVPRLISLAQKLLHLGRKLLAQLARFVAQICVFLRGVRVFVARFSPPLEVRLEGRALCRHGDEPIAEVRVSKDSCWLQEVMGLPFCLEAVMPLLKGILLAAVVACEASPRVLVGASSRRADTADLRLPQVPVRQLPLVVRHLVCEVCLGIHCRAQQVANGSLVGEAVNEPVVHRSQTPKAIAQRVLVGVLAHAQLFVHTLDNGDHLAQDRLLVLSPFHIVRARDLGHRLLQGSHAGGRTGRYGTAKIFDQ